ncbi:DUF4214 domain-containing protein [Halomonas sp. AOP30-A1-24]|uniref:DUF4214 domain-containing protein n=1 Tax=Halomonas sp. AOP30-A1-24 TaxID=3457698 RepID=UPI0040332210
MSDNRYQFDITDGHVLAIREWDDGRWENEAIDNDDRYSVQGNRIVKTEWNDDDITIYEDRGDGVYFEIFDGELNDWNRRNDSNDMNNIDGLDIQSDWDDRIDFNEDRLTYDQQVTLLYSAAFDRAPDQAGLTYWSNQMRGEDDLDLDDIAEIFMASDEFINRYGSNLNNSDFIEALYNNTLGRPSDAEGKEYWLNQLASDEDRDDILEAFALSDEHVDLVLIGQNNQDATIF